MLIVDALRTHVARKSYPHSICLPIAALADDPQCCDAMAVAGVLPLLQAALANGAIIDRNSPHVQVAVDKIEAAVVASNAR